MSWIDITKTIAAQDSWLDRIPALEKLAPSPAITVEGILQDIRDEVPTDGDDVSFWLVAAEVLSRVLSRAQLFEVVCTLQVGEFPYDAVQLIEYTFNTLRERYLPVAIEGLATNPRFALSHIDRSWDGLDERVPAVLDSAWPQIDALAGESLTAAKLCIRARRVTPMIVSLFARTMETILDETEAEHYDDQLEVEELLGYVASGRHAMRELAPSLVRFLRDDAPAYRWAASSAAVAINASTLRPEIDKAIVRAEKLRDKMSRQIEASIHLYASWLFGGPAEHLARATALGGENIVAKFRIGQAIEASPAEPRVLDGLRAIADDVAWVGYASSALAKLGGAEQLRSIAAPTPGTEGYLQWVGACFAAGIATRDETRVRYEAELSFHAWKPYAAIAVDDPIAEQRIRDALAEPNAAEHRALVGAVVETPALAMRLLPLLREREIDDAIYDLWRQGIAI